MSKKKKKKRKKGKKEKEKGKKRSHLTAEFDSKMTLLSGSSRQKELRRAKGSGSSTDREGKVR